MNTASFAIGSLLRGLACVAGCIAVVGCSSRANVAVTAVVPAQYSHVWITVKEVWLNTRETAGPEDADWLKFPLRTPAKIDLAALPDGRMSNILSEVDIPSDTYGQLRLLLDDSADARNEVESFDDQGAAQEIPLRLVNPERGIGVVARLPVETSSGSILHADKLLEHSSSSSVLIEFDAARDLTPFDYSGQLGYFLNPRLTVVDGDHAGKIEGQIDINAIATDANTGRPDVQVSAETLSADGSRHVVLKSAAIRADGGFTLYPLSTASGMPTEYDLVFHGPTVETAVVKAVRVGATDAASGTVLAAASSFTVNVDTGNPVTVRGARVGFYQTPTDSGSVPYSIEERPIDPISGLFAGDVTLSSGGGDYSLAGLVPLFDAASLDRTVEVPGSSASEPVRFVVSDPVVPSDVPVRSISFTFNIATAGLYDRGAVMVSHDGAIVAAASLDAVLAQTQNPQSLTLDALPAALYYAEVWVWSSGDPVGTISRQPHSAAIDLSANDANGIALNIE